MKVINLLNKITNGEEVPRKIKFRSSTFYYDKCLNWYYTFEKCEMFMDHTTLNEEIEIIKDKKTIKKEKHQMLLDTINELLDEGKITVYVYNELMGILLK